jgi:hypothetical protein
MAFVRLSRLIRPLALGLTCGVVLSSRAVATSDDDFKVNIRTEVDREWTLFSKKPAVVHSKVYSLAWIRPAKNNLTVPVDETALLQQLHDILAARGFSEPASGKVPDILLTVLYGRSTLKNPYEDPGIQVADAGLGGGGLQTSGNFGPSANQQSYANGPSGSGGEVIGGMDLFTADKDPASNEKRMRANEEKAFVSVTAWEFPGFMPKSKPKMLWRTTITADDPSLNLNLVGGKMFALGAPYFDREIKTKEITVTGSLADSSPTK